MKFNNWYATGYGDDSCWDETMTCELADEIENIDQANRRKRKALRELTRAVKERNEEIEELEKHVKDLQEKIDGLNWIEDLI